VVLQKGKYLKETDPELKALIDQVQKEPEIWGQHVSVETIKQAVT